MHVILLLYVMLMSITCVCVVAGNLLLLLLFVSHLQLRNDTWVLTLNLSVCDMIFGISIIPVLVYSSLFGGKIFFEGSTACQFLGFLFVLLQLASLNSLLWATIDKFTEICFPLRYAQIVTKKRIWIILVFLWIYSVGIAALPFMGLGKYSFNKDVYICLPYFGSSTKVYSVLLLGIGILAPVTVISVLYITIIHIARYQAKRGTFVCNDQHCYYVPIRSYFRNTLILIVSAFYLFVCWIPLVATSLYETFNTYNVPVIAKMVATWCGLLMPGLNPWINCLAQRKYRKALRESWRKFKRIFDILGPNAEPASDNERHSSIQPHQCLPGHNTENAAHT
ncbi:adenosine receptor A3-like [Pelodytes ibericus]